MARVYDCLEQKYDEVEVATTKYSRSNVYSGRRRERVITSGKIPTLFDSCLSVIRDNVELLEQVPEEIVQFLIPVLDKCSAAQLESVERDNPNIVLQSDDLWRKHVEREFKDEEPEEFESWRELYFVR